MSRWESFCVVGIGGHARTKLIPAIKANGQSIAGLVSRQPPEALPDAPIFGTLDAALAGVPSDTVFVIASPPSAHHAQVRAVIDAGFDVIVEKPAFVTAVEARDVTARCAATGTVLVEAFMQRHTGLYRRVLDFCAAHRVAAIDLAFVIPAMPSGTFRSESDLGASSLYDIGCYILALLGDLRLDLSALEITAVRETGTMAEAVDLAGILDGIAVTATIGVGPEYRNRASVGLADDSKTSFHPIFYGRPGLKTIGEEQIEDGNAFEAMFAVPRTQWLRDQDERFAGIIAVTARLEALAAQLEKFRADLGKR
ncbi:MAG: Gfo/Idh/MocA family oxidoreductase [Sphingomonas sp.]|nr:Gfo/Idh/MocA family oxidoreductase [Sphingomonas sp.]